MAKKVLVNLDMHGNEIQNVVMQILATAPTSPKEGQYYYNSTDRKAYQYVRTSEAGITPAIYAWKPLGGAEITVDSTLSSTSTNPVQNKVINSALGDKADKREAARMNSFYANQTSNGIDIIYDSVDTIDVANFTILEATDSDYGVVKLDSSVTASGANPVTGKAIYDYVGDAIAASDAMIFKGTIGTGGTVTALPTTYKTGWTYRVITAGTYASQDCEKGDLIIALVDRDGTGNLDSDWTVAQTNIDGAITDINATTPITVSGSGTSRTIGHTNSGVTAGSYGNSSDGTPKFGDTIKIPYITVDEKGHTTIAATHTIKIPDTMAQASANGGLMSYDQSEKLNAMPIIRQDWFTLSAGSTTAKKTLTPTPSKIISVQATAISTIQDLNHHTPVVVDWEYVEDDGDLTVSIASAYSNDIEIVVLYSK